MWVLQLCSSFTKLFWLIWFLLPFYINFRISLSISGEKTYWDFVWIVFNLQMNFGRIDFLTIMSPLILYLIWRVPFKIAPINEIIRSKCIKICARVVYCKIENKEERNQGRHNWLEIYTSYFNRDNLIRRIVNEVRICWFLNTNQNKRALKC